jgi:hypothetical protein
MQNGAKKSRRLFTDPLHRLHSRSIIGDDDLILRLALAREGTQHRQQRIGPVIGQDDKTDVHGWSDGQ